MFKWIMISEIFFERYNSKKMRLMCPIAHLRSSIFLNWAVIIFIYQPFGKEKSQRYHIKLWNHYLSIQRDIALNLKKKNPWNSLYTEECFMPSWSRQIKLFRRRFLKGVNAFSLFYSHLPFKLKTIIPLLNKLFELLNSKMVCAKFSLN